MIPELVAYTDGSCLRNPGAGGWAFVLIHCKSRNMLERAGAEASTTTNQRMELRAAIEALRQIQRPSRVTVFSDSEYVVDGASKFIVTWKKLGWRRKGGALDNLELWQDLDFVMSGHQIDWRYVKGHSADPGNDRVDVLAKQAAAQRTPWEQRGIWEYHLPNIRGGR